MVTRYLSSFSVEPESFISQRLCPEHLSTLCPCQGFSSLVFTVLFISRVYANDLEFLGCSEMAFWGQYLISDILNSH